MTKRVLQNWHWQPTVLAVSGCLLALSAAGCGSGFHYLPTTSSGSSPSAPTSGQTVSAPDNLGYAWNRSDQTLRPIQGVVGASHIGASIVQASSYVAGEASAISSLALLVRKDGSIDRITLNSSAKATLSGVSVPADARVRFSPSGTSAVLFVPGASTVVLVTNLVGTPQAVSLPTASLVDAAVSDAGTVAALQRSGTDSQLALVLPSGTQPINTTGGPGLLAFLPKSDNLLVLNTGANSVSLVRSFSTAPLTTQINTAGVLKTPVAFSVSQDGRWAAIANGDSSVARLDLSGGSAPQRIACTFQPTVVQALNTNAAFRFSDVGNAPAWISDLSAATPSMLFVPAVAKS